MSDVPEVVEADYSNQCYAEPSQPTYNLMNDPSFISALHQKLLEQQLPGVVVPIVTQITEFFWSSLPPMMESLFRKVVKEQLELIAEKRVDARGQRMPGDQTHHSEQRHLALKFSDRVSLPVYTGSEIKGEKGDSISVQLIDADENLVESGSEASSKVEIMVVSDATDDANSSSACGESGSCTKSIEKKPRKPLLSKKYMRLKRGIAVLENIKFKSNSKWTKNSMIKLVARPVGNVKGATVQNAETEPFLVSDRRGTLYKKRYPPSLTDPVWRLKEIRRNGKLHGLLSELKINTVGEFLTSHNTDPRSLQQSLSITANKLKVIVEHAKTCQIPGNLYIYRSPGGKRNVAVDFDAVARVRGLEVNGRFVPADDLAKDEKVHANKMVISAFGNGRGYVGLYDNEASSSVLLSEVPNHEYVNAISPCSHGSSSNGPNLEPNETRFDELDRAAIPQINRSPFSYSPGDSMWNNDIYPQTEYQTPENLFNLVFGEHDEHHQFSNLHSSARAKGRWKTLVVSVKSRSLRKRILAPPQDTDHTDDAQ